MRDADRRVSDVDVLAAGTRGPVGVDPQIPLVDLHFVDNLVEEGHYLKGSEGRLTLSLLVER